MSLIPNEIPVVESHVAEREKPSVALRAVAMFVAIVIAAPATAGGVWIIHQHYLRQKYSREGLPADAPIDRDLLRLREIYKSETLANSFRLQAFATQLNSISTTGPERHRDVSLKEWFFYCGPPTLMKASGDRMQYLYVAPMESNPPYAVEVLLTVHKSSPTVVAESEVRSVMPTNSGNGVTAIPFPRDGFLPYQRRDH